MTLDELLRTRSPRSDASLLDDCTPTEIADIRAELVARAARMTERERWLWETIFRDIPSGYAR